MIEEFVKYQKEKGLTQQEFADKLGVTRELLNKVINGKIDISKGLRLAFLALKGSEDISHKNQITLEEPKIQYVNKRRNLKNTPTEPTLMFYVVQIFFKAFTGKPLPRRHFSSNTSSNKKVSLMSERFTWTEPRLCNWGNDISRPWFIHFIFKDNETGLKKRLQFRGLINETSNKLERVREANALKSYWKKQLKAGWNPLVKNGDLPISRPRIIEAFDQIMQLKEISCSKRTVESYRYCTKLFIDWLKNNLIDQMYIDQFTVNHARAFFDYLAIKKGYSGRTYNDKIVTLSTFCNEMVDREWIAKNPFRKIRKLPIEVGRNIAFTDDEKAALRKHLYTHDRQMYYFTQFIYYCFIRRSELTRLKIGNIDWQNMSIVVPSSASKNRKQESVVIPDSFLPVLKEMNLKQLPADWYIFGRKLQPGPVQYINYNHISSRHNAFVEDLGISKEKGLYSWKHSGVCALYPVLNGDMYSMMRQLRHSELTTTQIYLKSLGLADNAAIRKAVW